jgi:hypothetical protein
MTGFRSSRRELSISERGRMNTDSLMDGHHGIDARGEPAHVARYEAGRSLPLFPAHGAPGGRATIGAAIFAFVIGCPEPGPGTLAFLVFADSRRRLLPRRAIRL